MQVVKTKNSYTTSFSLSEIKEDLEIDETDFTYDGRLLRLIKTACDIAEQYIQDDIVPTTTTITEQDYLINFAYLDYQLPSVSNIVISAITVSQGYPDVAVTKTLNPNQYAIEKFSNYTNVRFKDSISGNQLVITYTSGMNPIPQSIKQAITMKVRELFDVDVNGYADYHYTKTNTFELLLSPYKNLFY